MKKILSIVGARPQFIKHAPMQLALQKHFEALTIHTGQHYDAGMSAVFFNELNIPKPEYLFDIGGSKPQGAQTGFMMTEIEKVCLKEKPDALLVYGDTNSTLAGTLVAAKMHIPLIHIEAGLRSYNREMPEEVNRIIADEFASLLFCPTQQAVGNLKKEGIDHDGIHITGDVMCDMIELIRPQIRRLHKDSYYLATIHRPSNTDDLKQLGGILNALNKLSSPVIFPLHPRTEAAMQRFELDKTNYSNIQFCLPASYLDSISYQAFAECIITDSGGIQKEAYILKRKCITLRSETEWIETLQNGWNTLVQNLDTLTEVITQAPGFYIEGVYGDGKSASVIAQKIASFLH